MKKVALVAPVLTQSGYGVHARQVAKWLLGKEGIDLKIYPLNWGDTPWILNQEVGDGLIGAIMKKTVHPNDLSGCEVSFQLQLPNEWNPNLARINVGMTAGVETDVCNPEWVNNVNRMNLVIVPSQHVKQTFERSGKVTTPIIVIPESYFPELASDLTGSGVDLDLKTENNFLIVSQLTGTSPHTDRKNTFYAIKWLTEVFADRDDVGIVLKTNMGKNTTIDRALTTNIITKLMSEVRKDGKGPKVHLVHGSLDNNQMVSLYRNPKVKALISLTKGEGFGLPILEAAVAGLPVITTNWSGHLDFMSRGKFISVDCTLKEVHPSKIDGNIFMKGSRWAEADETDFKKKVKKFIDNQSAPREWAATLSETLLKDFSQEKVESLYDDALKEIL